MLRLTSKRPTLDVELDGAVVSVPLSLNHLELRSMAGADMADPMEMMGWFVSFLRPYLGDAVDGLGDGDLTALAAEWGEARASIGEPSLGEPAPSRG